MEYLERDYCQDSLAIGTLVRVHTPDVLHGKGTIGRVISQEKLDNFYPLDHLRIEKYPDKIPTKKRIIVQNSSLPYIMVITTGEYLRELIEPRNVESYCGHRFDEVEIGNIVQCQVCGGLFIKGKQIALCGKKDILIKDSIVYYPIKGKSVS